MHITTLLEMAADGFGDRVGFGSRHDGMTYAALLDRARRAGASARKLGVERLGLVDVNSEAVPIALFGSAFAGIPYVPMNYRLADEQLRGIVGRTAPSLAVAGADVVPRLADVDAVEVIERAAFLSSTVDPAMGGADDGPISDDPDDIAVQLFTSGTTGDPKAAVLRHRHLTSYILSTVEFMGAGEDEATLVSVPPYHIAGTAAVLSAVFAGRRICYLDTFTADAWVSMARDEQITHAMVVPTMLTRIVDVLDAAGEGLPSLRHIAYGGGRMPVPVIERALALLPHVGFVNAYGLTETSSTIAVLGPDEHREAMASDDPAGRARLGSVGRPLPCVEVEVRDEQGVATVDALGEVWVRGEQVAGEYLGVASTLDGGWFPTHDSGRLDHAGFLYIEGRLDDVIVRGAENMSPGEIEDVLVQHAAVADAAVVGVPDVEWGEKVVAAVVCAPGATVSESELREWVRGRLRSSRTPERIEFRAELPYTDTGKLLRRVIKTELAARYGLGGSLSR